MFFFFFFLFLFFVGLSWKLFWEVKALWLPESLSFMILLYDALLYGQRQAAAQQCAHVK
jgi:hypothetical protein